MSHPVGINGSVSFSMNGGRTEYNNWELDGGDNMDNGSNGTLNVYPSIDAISEFKVLTSNYGAQYGRNGSGRSKSKLKAEPGHSMAMRTNLCAMTCSTRKTTSTAPRPAERALSPHTRRTISATQSAVQYLFPVVYNRKRQKTFFFWSQEWRRDRLPASFNTPVPSTAERTGNFSICARRRGSRLSSDLATDCPHSIPGRHGRSIPQYHVSRSGSPRHCYR